MAPPPPPSFIIIIIISSSNTSQVQTNRDTARDWSQVFSVDRGDASAPGYQWIGDDIGLIGPVIESNSSTRWS